MSDAAPGTDDIGIHKTTPFVYGAMSARAEGDSDGSVFEDPWVRDVTKMGVIWFVATVVGIVILLYVLPQFL